MTLAELNSRIAKIAPNVELVRGEGYHYFVFDDGSAYETESVMVPYTKDLPAARWIEDAEAFSRRVLADLAEAAETARPAGRFVLSLR